MSDETLLLPPHYHVEISETSAGQRLTFAYFSTFPRMQIRMLTTLVIPWNLNVDFDCAFDKKARCILRHHFYTRLITLCALNLPSYSKNNRERLLACLTHILQIILIDEHTCSINNP